MNQPPNQLVESAKRLLRKFPVLHSSLKSVRKAFQPRSLSVVEPLSPVGIPENVEPIAAIVEPSAPPAVVLGKQDRDEVEVLLTKQDWRKLCSQMLNGRGLEIGPLQKPMCTHPGMQMEYIDRCTVAELRAQYPELNELPLVEPQIIGDAETLQVVPSNTYDFLIAAHVIEHMRNPIGALSHWLRVIKPGGLLYLVVPDKRYIFDYHRARTSLAHLILDYRQPSRERDFEHYIDFAISPRKKTGEAAIQEARDMVESDYSIHFHTFIPTDVVRLLAWFKENVAPVEILLGPAKIPEDEEFHFVLRKPLAN